MKVMLLDQGRIVEFDRYVILYRPRILGLRADISP
jgi:hypothetical protein